MLKEMPKAKIKSYKNSNSKQDLTCASFSTERALVKEQKPMPFCKAAAQRHRICCELPLGFPP